MQLSSLGAKPENAAELQRALEKPACRGEGRSPGACAAGSRRHGSVLGQDLGKKSFFLGFFGFFLFGRQEVEKRQFWWVRVGFPKSHCAGVCSVSGCVACWVV